MVLQSKNWCFTLNNYTHDDTVRLLALETCDCVEYVVFGKEVGESGTPHYQGYVKFTSKKRVNGVKKIIGECHVECARNPSAAIRHCKKDNDFVEFGEIKNEQGKRSDLDAFKEDVNSGILDVEYYVENHSDCFSRNRSFCLDYIRLRTPGRKIVPKPLRKWQAKLWLELKRAPDDRTIKFYVDLNGLCGKSWFMLYYYQMHPKVVHICNGGELGDLAFLCNEQCRVCFIDLARVTTEQFPWEFLENLKNGFIFSGKYQSVNKLFEPPHVVVFMNQLPKSDLHSADRCDITTIDASMNEISDQPVLLDPPASV